MDKNIIASDLINAAVKKYGKSVKIDDNLNDAIIEVLNGTSVEEAADMLTIDTD